MKKLIYILIASCLCWSVFGIPITDFYSGLPYANFSFENNTNFTTFVDLPRYSVIANASLNFTWISYYLESYFTNLSICHQENANDSASCIVSPNGDYQAGFPLAGRDNDYTTYYDTDGSGVQLTYQKPQNSTSVKWEYKDSSTQENITIPSECFNYNSTHIRFMIYGHESSAGVDYYCWNSSALSQYKLLLSTTSGFDFFEERVFWSIGNSSSIAYNTTNATNLYVETGTFTGAKDHNLSGNISGKNLNITLNVSKLNQLKSSCSCYNCTLINSYTCRVPIMFHSGIKGNLNLYNLYITDYKQIILIDEFTGGLFNVSNLSFARAYYEDNSSYFDFKTTNSSTANITNVNNKVRIDLGYYEDHTEIISRYVDLDLISSVSEIRICANKDDIHHKQLLLVSAINKPVLLKSIYANCYVAADYTRFAYQGALILKAFVIGRSYALTTYDNGTEVNLAGLDGSIETYVDIDTLEFNNQGYNINILSDSLSFQKVEPSQVKIYYKNLKSNNLDLSLKITRTDTNVMVYSKDDFSNPHEFTIYYDYSLETGLTNMTVFRVDVEKTTAQGTESFKRYFNLNAKTGILTSGFGFAIAILLTIFGLTFTISRITFSWFGIMLVGGSIAVMSFTIKSWFVNMFIAVDVIILIYVILIMLKQNTQTLS